MTKPETPPTAPLAVVGMACRFPGADNLDEYWELILEGQSGISTIPADRLDQQLYYDPNPERMGRSYSRIGGIVSPRPLDRDLCPIPKESVGRYDVTHQILCEVACAACQDAGYHPAQFPVTNTGVFIGNSSGSNLEADLVYHSHAEEFAEILRETQSFQKLTGSDGPTITAELVDSIRSLYPAWSECPVSDVTSAAAAELVSRTLKLTGPSLAVDAACASSFMSLQLAATALQRGRIDAAIVGAFSYRNWFEMVLLSQAQAMSATGSRPFSADADGMVPSDGYAAVVIKTLAQATADGDHIYGVIRSMGISSDGRGKGFWAPRQEGQVEAIRRAYERGIDPGTVQYIEAHATSTQLGDSTEVAALGEVFGDVLSEQIPIAGVKGNIGHTLEAAGMAGLVKTLLALDRRVIPPATRCDQLNPNIDWQQLPFVVPSQPSEWTAPIDGHPRRAAIDAFGIGGINAHVVVDEAPQSPDAASPQSFPAPQQMQPHAGPEKDDIAVIGINQLVHDVNPFAAIASLECLRNGESRFAAANDSQSEETCDHSADYVFDWKKHKIPPKQVAKANPLQFMLLDAAVAALEDAGYAERELDRSRAGTVVGSPFTSDFSCDTFLSVRLPEIQHTISSLLQQRGRSAEEIREVTTAFEETLLQIKPAARDETGSLASSTLASRIAKQLDLMGGAMSIDAGADSPSMALATAVDLLQSGTCNLVVCAAGQQTTDIAFQDQHAAGKGLRPASGTKVGNSLLTEGAAAVVLKRLSDARRDGDPIRTILATNDTERLWPQFSGDLTPGCPDAAEINDPVISSEKLSERERPRQAGERENQNVDSLADELIETLVELTGYPKEMVKLDSDFYGDLGIGRNVRLQLFNEYPLRFPESRSLQDSLDDIHTLQELLDILVNEQPPPSNETTVEEGSAKREAQNSGLLPVMPESERMMSRFVLRTVESSLEKSVSTASALSGPVFILGENAAAVALGQRLSGLDLRVYQIPVNGGVDLALRELDRVWSAQPVPNLFLMTARDEQATAEFEDSVAWNRRSADGLMLPYLVCQHWFEKVSEAKLIDRACLAAVTSLGGDFGFGGSIESVEGGGITGLLKAIDSETQSRLSVRVIDAPPNEPPKMIAAALCRELSAESGDVETATVRGKRHVVSAVRQPVEPLARCELRRNAVWVVTGGACRFTAVAARELGRRYGWKLHLLGSSPRPSIDETWRNLSVEEFKELRWKIMREARAAGQSPLDAWSRIEKAIELDGQLRAFAAVGVEAVYHQCDVTDRRQLSGVLAAIRSESGPIDGVMHGAGIETAAQFRKKKRPIVEEVLRVKLEGAAALMELTTRDPLTHFVAFGSTGGRFGEPVQTDASLANEMLAKMVTLYHRRRPECRAFTVHWPAFDPASTSTLPGSLAKSRATAVRHMSPAEGVAHLADELEADSRETEILIVDHPGGIHSERIIMPSLAACETEKDLRNRVARTPLIEQMFADRDGHGVAEAVFDPQVDPFLRGHLHDGIPLLPAVIGIETCAQAASAWFDNRYVVEIRDQKLGSGFRMESGNKHRGRVRISGTHELAECQVSGDFYDSQRRLIDPNRVYQTCAIQLADSPRIIPPPDLGIPPSDWNQIPYPDDWRAMNSAESGSVFYGPELRTLKSVRHQPDGSWGQMVAPSLTELMGSRQGTRLHTPSALLDGALFLCDLFAADSFGGQQLPHVIDRISFGRLPKTDEACLIRCVFRGRQERRLSWDFWIIGADGAVILSSTGCHFVDLNRPANVAATAGQ